MKKCSFRSLRQRRSVEGPCFFKIRIGHQHEELIAALPVDRATFDAEIAKYPHYNGQKVSIDDLLRELSVQVSEVVKIHEQDSNWRLVAEAAPVLWS